jgi:hypothetical protein
MLMKFSFDPELIAKAREIILHRPNLNVLSAEREAEYSPLVRSMEGEFKKRHAAGKLLLPDLSALANQTVGIFSDYSGESIGNYDTYSFLICAWGSLGPFRQQMQQVREKCAMGSKEIEFKDFGMGTIQRALPSYLETLNGYVPGLLFTLVIDKRLVSLFGARDRSTARALAKILEERGFGARKPLVAEKVMRVIHTAAYLTALLGHEGQKIFWMTDHDSICPTPEMHNRMLELFHNVLGLYTSTKFGLIGGARPFAERSTDYLDLLSATDIAAGAVAQYFTGRDEVGEHDVCVKPGAEKVLQWLGLDAWALKKLCVMISAGDNGAILSGTVECASRQMPETATFLPTQLCR